MRADRADLDMRWLRPAVVVVAALPVVVAVVSLLGRHWYASSDQALIALRIDDVGSGHTPLVGVGSRLGWAHPGPLLFWVLAPFRRLLGPTGVLPGVATVNLLAVVGVVVVGWRRGGARMAVLLGLAVAVLVHTLGLTALFDPWNPTAAFLPFLLFAVLVWAILTGDLAMLPLAVAAGSWSVQSHVGYLPLVAGLLVLAVVSVVVAGRGRPDRHLGRWAAVAGVVGIVLWLPPLVEQATTDPGNLELLADYARDPGEAPRGWGDAVGVLGIQLQPAGAWITGDDVTDVGVARTGAVAPAIAVLLALAASTYWAWRRDDRPVAFLGVVALTGAGLATVATSRVTGLFVPYIFRWWWAVAALTAVTIVHAALDALVPSGGRSQAAATIAPFVVAAGLTVLVVAGAPADLPFEDVSDAIGDVAGPVADRLDPDAVYLVRGVDSATFGASTHGLFLELERRGIKVRADRLPTAELAYGEWRLADPDDVDGIVTIVAGPDHDDGFRPPEGSELLARSRGPDGGYRVYLLPAP